MALSLYWKSPARLTGSLFLCWGFFVWAEFVDKTRRPDQDWERRAAARTGWAWQLHVFPLICRLTARLWLGLIPVNAVSSLSPHFISAFSGRVVSEAQRQNILVSETFVFQDGKSVFRFYFSPITSGNWWGKFFPWKIFRVGSKSKNVLPCNPAEAAVGFLKISIIGIFLLKVLILTLSRWTSR